MTMLARALAAVFIVCSTVCRAQNNDAFRLVQQDALNRSSTAGGLEGIALADFNGDGVLDQFLCNYLSGDAHRVPADDYSQRLLIGTGLGDGSFVDTTANSSGLQDRSCSAVVAADLDSDGIPDLVTTLSSAESDGCRVYINAGNGRFLEWPQGFEDCPPFPGGIALADVNNDGFLDAFVTAWIGPVTSLTSNDSMLLLSDGDGRFSKLPQSGAESVKFACEASFSDLDDDGDQDLLVWSCNSVMQELLFFTLPNPSPVMLLRNSFSENGLVQFRDATDEFIIGEIPRGFWMSSTFGDVNGDGHLDFYAGNIGCGLEQALNPLSSFFTVPCASSHRHALFLNNGRGRYREFGEEWGLAEGLFNWGAAFVDIDNDGDDDLVSVGNLISSLPYYTATRAGFKVYNPGSVYRNDYYHFNLIQELNISSGSALAVGDLNGDGLEDVVLQRSGYVDHDGLLVESGDAVILVNDNDAANAWLRVRLRGTRSNRDAIGAKVTVRWSTVDEDDRVQVKAIVAGSSFRSSHEQVLTFGLGRLVSIHAMEVQWPNGSRQQVNETQSIVANSTFHIREE